MQALELGPSRNPGFWPSAELPPICPVTKPLGSGPGRVDWVGRQLASTAGRGAGASPHWESTGKKAAGIATDSCFSTEHFGNIPWFNAVSAVPLPPFQMPGEGEGHPGNAKELGEGPAASENGLLSHVSGPLSTPLYILSPRAPQACHLGMGTHSALPGMLLGEEKGSLLGLSLTPQRVRAPRFTPLKAINWREVGAEGRSPALDFRRIDSLREEFVSPLLFSAEH